MTDVVTAEELDQALPHVMAAPRKDGPVTMLIYRRKCNDRVFTQRLRLTGINGVEGDFQMSMPCLKLEDGSPDKRIQVSILPSRVTAGARAVHPGLEAEFDRLYARRAEL